MRVIFAGLFVFILLLIFVSFTGKYIEGGNSILWGIACAFVMFILVGIASYIFNMRSFRPDGKSPEERIREWELAGLVENRSYRAQRYFEVNEFDDEGLHYFIELENKKVLYLNGQYLYDYEKIEEPSDSGINQDKTFPCTDFVVQINKEGPFVFNVKIDGQLIEKVFGQIDFPKWYGNKGMVFYNDMQEINNTLEGVYQILVSKNGIKNK